MSQKQAFFSIIEPTAPATPLVVEVPHAGLYADPPALAGIIAPAYALARDADLYVDELYADAPAFGATLLVSHVTRYVCDLNRAESDLDYLAVEGRGNCQSPHGLIWRITTDQRPALREPLPLAELERRLELFYRPYHRVLSDLLEQRRGCFGYAILLSAHSMPTVVEGRPNPKAQVVPGSRGGTSAASEVLQVADQVAKSWGWSVAHDDPYRGGFTTGHYGRPAQGYHALQLELARKLYMDERLLTKKPKDFDSVRGFCQELVKRLARLRLGEPSSLPPPSLSRSLP